jgi:hypothetical protein
MRCANAQKELISSSKTPCLGGAIFTCIHAADGSHLGLRILLLLNFLLAALQQSRLFLMSDPDWTVYDCHNDHVQLTPSDKLLHLFRISHDDFLRFEQPVLPSPLRVVLLKSSLAMKRFFN